MTHPIQWRLFGLWTRRRKRDGQVIARTKVTPYVLNRLRLVQEGDYLVVEENAKRAVESDPPYVLAIKKARRNVSR